MRLITYSSRLLKAFLRMVRLSGDSKMGNLLKTKKIFRQKIINLYFDGILKPSEKSVLMTLASFLGRNGLYPSHEKIALACRYSIRTVIRSLERAYELGLVERTHRMTNKNGQKVRTSNTYKLIITPLEQEKIAKKHLSRALFSKAKHLTAKTADKVSSNNFFKKTLNFQPPKMTREEMIVEILSWSKVVLE